MDDSIMVDKTKKEITHLKSVLASLFGWLFSWKKIAIYDVNGKVILFKIGYSRKEVVGIFQEVLKEIYHQEIIENEIDNIIKGDFVR